LLRVDPERRFFTPPSKAGLGAAERVNQPLQIIMRFFISHFLFATLGVPKSLDQ
jgi:hypothetical protein